MGDFLEWECSHHKKETLNNKINKWEVRSQTNEKKTSNSRVQKLLKWLKHFWLASYSYWTEKIIQIYKLHKKIEVIHKRIKCEKQTWKEEKSIRLRDGKKIFIIIFGIENRILNVLGSFFSYSRAVCTWEWYWLVCESKWLG